MYTLASLGVRILTIGACVVAASGNERTLAAWWSAEWWSAGYGGVAFTQSATTPPGSYTDFVPATTGRGWQHYTVRGPTTSTAARPVRLTVCELHQHDARGVWRRYHVLRLTEDCHQLREHTVRPSGAAAYDWGSRYGYQVYVSRTAGPGLQPYTLVLCRVAAGERQGSIYSQLSAACRPGSTTVETQAFYAPGNAINGGWSSWGNWGSCSKTCGTGSRARNRTCNNPSPQYGGRSCSGSSSLTGSCNTASCPVDGAWSSWQSWTGCSRTCGSGTRSRLRICSSPAPQHGGDDCSTSDNSASQHDSCYVKTCDPAGGSSLSTTTETSTSDAGCVSSCKGMVPGDYQSCLGCHVYITCAAGGVVYDGRPCPGGLVWDDTNKYCDWTSTTCPRPTN